MSDDPPIQPPHGGFLGGANIVDIGDIRVARGLTRRPHSGCQHQTLYYDATERRVWCPDCETTIEAFDAFEMIINQFDRARKQLEKRERAVNDAEQASLRSLAARAIDKAWRKRRMLPCCPTCKAGLFPEDFKNGITSMVSREYAQAMRRKQQGGSSG